MGDKIICNVDICLSNENTRHTKNDSPIEIAGIQALTISRETSAGRIEGVYPRDKTFVFISIEYSFQIALQQ